MKNSENQILALLKIHPIKFINDFQQNGTLFLRRLSDFASMENRQSKDENENLSYILQKKDCMPLKVNGKEIVNSLIGPLKVGMGVIHMSFVCMP